MSTTQHAKSAQLKRALIGENISTLVPRPHTPTKEYTFVGGVWPGDEAKKIATTALM